MTNDDAAQLAKRIWRAILTDPHDNNMHTGCVGYPPEECSLYGLIYETIKGGDS